MSALQNTLAAIAFVLSTLWGSVDASAQRRLDEAGYEQAVEALSASEPDARIAAVEAIGHGGWRFRRQAASHLRRLIRNDPDWRVRASSVRAVGGLNLREAMPDLVRALRDRQVDVRIVAAGALSRMPDSAAVPALLDLLTDEHPSARQWAALALGVTRDTRATEPLLLLLNDTASEVRLEAIRSLGRIADPAALTGLRDFITDATRPENERFESVQALASLRGAEKREALVALLDAPDTNLRLHIVRALGQVGEPAQLAVLRVRRAAESEARVRTRIDEAIIAIEERARRQSEE